MISSAAQSGRATPALPPIKYESMHQNEEHSAVPQNKRLTPKNGKSGIPVYAGRKASSMIGYTSQTKRTNLQRGKSFDRADKQERNHNDNRYRTGGALSRAGNHSRLSRAYSHDGITRLPPISPGKRGRT